MPRERALAYGVNQLTTEELLMILLRTGTAKCKVRALARNILDEFSGNLPMLARNSSDLELMTEKFPGLGLVKALEIASVFEIAKRFSQSKQFQDSPRASEAEFVASYVWSLLGSASNESFIAIPLDRKLHPLARGEITIISRGTADMTLVHPRDVYRLAVRHNASYVVVAHNHPSGDPTPSSQDRHLTDALVKAGQLLHIPLLDHVIVGDATHFYSMRREGDSSFES